MGAIDSALQNEVLLPTGAETASDQLLAYARDLRETVQAERAQRRLLQQAYRQTISTLTDALEAKSKATGHHGLRVQRYAVELTEALEPSLLDDPSLEYGFLLHDIGKIGIPEAILEKRGALEAEERKVMQRHPLIGTELLADVPMLEGEGLQVVRSHHERWDGQGYPDGLRGEEIPPVARIFAVADTLDAMTTDRPYRMRCKWEPGRRRDPAGERPAVRPRSGQGVRDPGATAAAHPARAGKERLTPEGPAHQGVKEKPACAGLLQVGGTGLEPVTPSLSSWCSPN